MAKNTKNTSSANKELAERASAKEAGRIATALARQNERRENQESMRLQGKGPDAEKAAQDLRVQKERADQAQAAQQQRRQMEQERRDEQDRLVNQLQRENGVKPSRQPTAVEQMKARAVERGHLKDSTQEGEQGGAGARNSLEQMREQAEARAADKEQRSDEQDMER